MARISPPICPHCHKAMELLLTKGDQRVMRCIDCGQPDPLLVRETNRWLAGELGERK